MALTDARSDGGDRGAVGRTTFRPDIEGLRAIAVIAVLAYHLKIRGSGGGFLGVDLFFVISGYLITGHLVSDAIAGRGVRFADFYARRIRRILPAATVTIVGTIAAGFVLQNPLEIQLMDRDARSSALFFSNIWFWSESTDYLAEERSLSLFQQFWSLSLEEQFYILWPAVIGLVTWAAVRANGGFTELVRRWLIMVLALLVIVSFLLSVDAAANDPIGGFFLLQYRWWELGVGALLALTAHRVGPVVARWATPVAIVALAAILVPIALYGSETPWPGLAAAVPVVGTVFLIAAGVVDDRHPIGRLIGLRPMQAIGRYSYSIYLWHWPLVVLIAEPGGYAARWVIVVVLLTAALAVASFHAIERPFRVSRTLQTRTRLTLVVGAGLVVIGVLASFAPTLFGPRLDTGRESGAPPHRTGDPIVATEFVPSDLEPPLVDGTSDADPNAARNVDCDDVGDCSSGDADAPFHVVVFGDSHADHWAPAVQAFADSRGGRFDRLTKPGCATFKVDTVRCADWLAARWTDIRELAPDVLVLANRHDGDVAGAERMTEVVEKAPNNTRVFVISETPDGPKSIPLCLAENLERVRACEHPWPNATIDDVNNALSRSVTAGGGTFLDVTPLLCQENRCPAIAGNVLVYRDANHLTTAFVASRTGDLIALLDG